MNTEPRPYLGPKPNHDHQTVILKELLDRALTRSWAPDNEAKEKAKLIALTEYLDGQGIDVETIAADLKEQRISGIPEEVSASTDLGVPPVSVPTNVETEVDTYNTERQQLTKQLLVLYEKKAAGEMTDEDCGALAVVVEDMRHLDIDPEFILSQAKRTDSA